jgi:hypothetical protein
MIGFIGEDGKYQKGKKNLGHDVSSMHKDWRHSMERKKFSREIIQPYKNGKPNPKFVRAYEETSKEYFNEQQIRSAEREL